MCIIHVVTDENAAEALKQHHGDKAKVCKCDDVSIYRKIDDEESKKLLDYPGKAYIVVVC